MLKILTLSWQGKDKLEALYPSLVKSLDNVDYEWFIKDNGSKDDTISLEKIWNNNKVNIIPYPHNRDNFSSGCNFLFREASSKSEDLILLLNNDIIFNDIHSIKSMINLLDKDNSIGAVGARLIYKNTNKLQHAGVVFDPTYKTPTHFRVNEIVDVNSGKNREFQAVTGAVWLTKASYYENICRTNKSNLHGLDEEFIWCFEDVSACLSIKYNMHKKIVYCGTTNIFHEESATLKKNPANKMFLPHNLKYLFGKWHKRYNIDKDIYTNDSNYNLYEA